MDDLVVEKLPQTTRVKKWKGRSTKRRLGSSQEIDPHLQRDERLNNPIVKISSEAVPLHGLRQRRRDNRYLL
jgi:hypothetical protein